MVGKTISHYKVLDKIAEGGMGVVYKAEDTRLHRPVALKFLRRETVESEELRARFLHEAEAAAALDHPNICTVYEIDDADGQTFLSMAFVEGDNVADKVRERPLPLDEALDIAVQAAEGLHAAHRKEVVHRDIKSANIMVNSEGRVKIMDFGLAHLTGGTRITKTGTVVGTPAYMSPEQVRGETVDQRTDTWSLGVVIYEMVTGRLPFSGESAQSVALAIQNEEPEPLTALRAGVPMELERIVGKMLAKSAGERYPHVEDLLVDLRSLKRRLESGPSRQVEHTKRGSRAGWYVAGAVLVAALAVGAWLGLRGPATTTPEAPLTPVPLTTYPGTERSPSFSPDGDEVAFAWDGEDENNFDIYRKLIGPDGPLRLTSHPAEEDWPAWSPDGRQIAFVRDLGAGKTGIFLIPALGGVERQLVERDISTNDWRFLRLAWSPDGKWLVISDRITSETQRAVYLLSVATRERRQITFPPETFPTGDHGASFSPDGRSLVFVRSQAWFVGDVYSLSFSDELRPAGEPKRLAFENRSTDQPAWTPDGREIVFTFLSGPMSRLWRLAASGPGELRPLTSIGAGASRPAISSQGHRLAYSQSASDANIWRIGLSGSQGQATAPERLIHSTRDDWQPHWSPDGTRIAFLSHRSGNTEIWVCDSNGSNATQLTSSGNRHVAWPAWSPDGKLLAFEFSEPGQRDIYVVDANGGAPQRITTDPADDAVPSWSRDGKWIYFASIRGALSQVWKIPAGGGEALQVTKGGGRVAFEAADGEHVYYSISGDAPSLWKVPVAGGEESPVIESLHHHTHFSLAASGGYFVPGDGRSIQFLSFATGETMLIASSEEPFTVFSVSPDEKWILYARREQTGADLMLVENFR